MTEDRLFQLAAEIERLRTVLEAIRDTPRKLGILTCQQMAVRALEGSDIATQPREKALGDPLYFREAIQYLRWRYKDKCAYCGGIERLEIDHVKPVSRGGSDEINNLVLCCHQCNQRKGTQTAAEFGFRTLGLIAAGASLNGWRKQKARQEAEYGRLEQLLRERKAAEAVAETK